MGYTYQLILKCSAVAARETETMANRIGVTALGNGTYIKNYTLP